MRKIVIAGNWKMNKTVAESVKLAADVVAAAKDIKSVVVAIAPTYLALAKVAEVVKETTSGLPLRMCTGKTRALIPERSAQTCSRKSASIS